FSIAETLIRAVMRDRFLPAPPASTRTPSGRSPYSIDVVLLTPRGKQLAVLCERARDPRARERWQLPTHWVEGDETLEVAARRVAATSVGAEPTWIAQVGAFADGRAHPSDAELSVAFVAVVPAARLERSDAESAWFSVGEPPTLPARHRTMLDAAVATLRARVDDAPIAFHLLPELFTLTELQAMYELLLGRRLHKASFRRALQAADLVEATDEWRSEGRGRPAQYFRFVPRRRTDGPRSVRFDLL
ncbi:MAG TPA: NUDIX domain-containing protein, partial [Gemmatimonadaceae bacterium]|nr:NUDIX domain-containing protein [Gemmatimonadaceae bacterium]